MSRTSLKKYILPRKLLKFLTKLIVRPENMCSCKQNSKIIGATCPYDSDINAYINVCNCCEDCQNRCADEI